MKYVKAKKAMDINTEVLEGKVNRYIWAINIVRATTKQEAKDIAIATSGLIPDRTNPVIQELEQVLELIDKNGHKVWTK